MFKPVTAQPDFAKQEEEIEKYWQENDIFNKSVEKNKGKEPYIIYDGPPTANAKPPLHTMVPMSFKDLVGRYQTMRGKYVPRQGGWDTHGLPVEVQVEKALGLTNKKDILNLVPGDERASIEKFNAICRQSVWDYKQEWDKYVPRVGYWTDTKHPYITYESSYIEKVWGVFKQIWDKDLVYKSYKVLPYCPRCGTALSAAEVAQEYQDTKDVSVYVSFPLVENSGRSFLAWTTTPWTLPGNVALAVGADIDYVVVKQKKEGEEVKEYILAHSRLSILSGEYEIIENLKGSDLVGMSYQGLYPEAMEAVKEKKYYVVAADFVTTEDGTGIVHTAVMYGEDDFQLGKAVGLPMLHTVGLDGRFLPLVAEFAGMDIREALVPILKSLAEKGRLYAKQTITHSYPFCWRCKTALIYYAKDSWFIAMSQVREPLVAANQAVEWFPGHIKEGRFGDFIREARDWAISRERFWGTPLPVWVNEAGQTLCIGSLAELKELAKDPAQINEKFDPHRPFIDEIILIKDGQEYKREPLVMDVWFDSGSMPYASGRDELGQFPADFIAEAIDQTRGWFYSLQAIGSIVKGQSPYKRVVCMGHLVDDQGKKMSKSGPNAFDPWPTFAVHGVDPIRWFVYTVNSPGEAKAFSLKEIQTSFRGSVLLLWNIYNYFVTHAILNNFTGLSEQQRQDLRKNHTFNDKNLGALDLWMLNKQIEISTQVTEFLESYDFMRAGRLLESYINDFSTWYLRRSRKRTDTAFFAVTYDALLNLVTMLAPFMPYISEALYQNLRQEDQPESVHLMSWPENLGDFNPLLIASMSTIREAVELGLSLRAAHGMKVRQPLAAAAIITTSPLDEEYLQIMADELNIEKVSQVSEFENGWVQKVQNELSVALDINLTEELVEAGAARELLRNIQQLRKKMGLQPGQSATLVVSPHFRSLVEPIIIKYPEILKDSFLEVNHNYSWSKIGQEEIEWNGQTVELSLEPLT